MSIIYNILPLTQTLEELFEEAKNSTILKAVVENKMVGSVRAFEKDGSCFIGRLIVHPDYQNSGIGRKLMADIENNFGCIRFELFTGHLDKKNLAFYDKLYKKHY
ncbi:MAG: GNAT family N-acetyltransferase [Bacillota bacterium]|nr:GNAT family N-acetyltransferase [Bacillota bacterium]